MTPMAMEVVKADSMAMEAEKATTTVVASTAMTPMAMDAVKAASMTPMVTAVASMAMAPMTMEAVKVVSMAVPANGNDANGNGDSEGGFNDAGDGSGGFNGNDADDNGGGEGGFDGSRGNAVGDICCGGERQWALLSRSVVLRDGLEAMRNVM